MTPKEIARDLFPTPAKKRCGSPGCSKVVIVCLGCLKRGCRHKLTNAGWLDVTTGEDRGQMSFVQLVDETDRLLPLGVCLKCRLAKGGVDRERGIAAIMALLPKKDFFVAG